MNESGSVLQTSAKTVLARVVFICFRSHEVTVPAMGGGGESLILCFDPAATMRSELTQVFSFPRAMLPT
jgi:hypothetical protein